MEYSQSSSIAEVIACLKPGGKLGNVNYLGEGEFIKIPRVEWGVGMVDMKVLTR